MIIVVKPSLEDLSRIENILTQWNIVGDVEQNVKRITNEINGKTEFNMQFWIARENDEVLGVTGLSDPLPKVIRFAKNTKPAEIKILYVDKDKQGKGIGRKLVSFVEEEARIKGYNELLVRSALIYKDTAWGFYKKMGYADVGKLEKGEREPIQVFEKLLDWQTSKTVIN